MINLTPAARLLLLHRARRARRAALSPVESQIRQLRWILFHAADTEFGRKHHLDSLLSLDDPRREFATLCQLHDYEWFRSDIMRMVRGQKDVLWPGRCRYFAQSSGTSGGRSKYVPVTDASLYLNHYHGASDSVALYLDSYPDSRLFAGKGLILGGSFESQLRTDDPAVKVGDLSATLIDRIYPLANIFRVPDKQTALLSDWSVKLDLLARKAVKENLTNISGVPSWFMKVLEHALEISGKSSLREIWPSLEVFFHGGINFEPYRESYDNLFGQGTFRYWENYNASEGFFACRANPGGDMMLLTDAAVYFEFIPLSEPDRVCMIEELRPDTTYELVITAPNGLFRYRPGDTVRVTSLDPVTIRVAGRTHAFINAFGEELMVDNAERAIAAAATESGAAVANYTAAPEYSHGGKRGRHRWLVEWAVPPRDPKAFPLLLDEKLRMLNSDYDAKRRGDIFLDPPEIIDAPKGTFDRWLAHAGNGKLGGQRKIPRLANDPSILNDILSSISKLTQHNEKD